MKRVLVTGSSGFIGRHCLPFLIDKGFEVYGVIPTGDLKLDLPQVQWVVADILEPSAVRSLFEKVKPGYLIHLAWYTAPESYWTSAENLRWLQASVEILRAFKSSGGQRLLCAGSCAEYDWHYGYCSEQVTPLAPSSLYGVCKKAFHDVLLSFACQDRFSAAWGRVFFLYGPHEHPTRLIPSVINSLLDGKPAQCTHGNQIRDFLHVEDVASAFVALLDSKVEGAVNIASGEPVTLKNIVYQIGEKMEQRDRIELGAIPVSTNEAPLVVGDTNRLRLEVGWEPRYTLETGIEMTIDWWKKQRQL